MELGFWNIWWWMRLLKPTLGLEAIAAAAAAAAMPADEKFYTYNIFCSTFTQAFAALHLQNPLHEHWMDSIFFRSLQSTN